MTTSDPQGGIHWQNRGLLLSLAQTASSWQ